MSSGNIQNQPGNLAFEFARNLNRNVALERGDSGYFVFVGSPLCHVCKTLDEAQETASTYIDGLDDIQIERHTPAKPIEKYRFNQTEGKWKIAT